MNAASPTRAPETARIHGIAAFALCAAAIQLLASVVLELASPRAIGIAGARGAQWFYIILGVTVIAIWAARLLYERPAIALAVAGISIGLTLNFARTKVGVLNLAIHAEPVSFHLVAVLSLALIVSIALKWRAHAELSESLGRRLLIPVALALLAGLMLFSEHLGAALPASPAFLRSSAWRGFGRLLILCAWPAAAWLFWHAMQPHHARWLPPFLILLLVVRVVAGGAGGLLGDTVVGTGASVVGGCFVLTALAAAVLLRPQVDWVIHIIVGLASVGACLMFLWLYYAAYGNIEDGLASILRSLFAFDVPLPFQANPGWWKPAVVMVGIFFLIYTAYACIVSRDSRWRGVALALMAFAGLNLSSPYLVLLLGAGGMLFVDTLLWSAAPLPARASAHADSGSGQPNNASPSSLGGLFEGLTDRLGFDPPLKVDAGRGELWALNGTVDGVPVDLRARTGARAGSLELTCGVLGNEAPPLALLWDPGTHGQRPAHSVAANYRLEGEPRALEALGDRPLDALSPFRGATVQMWDAGVLALLHREDPAVNCDSVEALVRALARACRD